MKRQLLSLFTLAAVMVCVSINSAEAAGGGHRGHGGGHRGFGGLGVAIGGGYDGGWDIAELYRQLYNNLPYFALHPPVYYSYPVPRTYGYSPFAYLPNVMTPDVAFCPEPATIINPYVPSSKQESSKPQGDQTASTASPSRQQSQPQPLVIINPYVTGAKAVAQTDR